MTHVIASAVSPCGQLVLPAIPDAVRLSRRLVRDLCELMRMDEIADVAELLAGEIVSNVVLHTRTPFFRVTAEVSAATLRVSVFDNDPHLPTMRHPSEKEPRGRGLVLVDSLSQDWGAVESPGGKLVWFTVSSPNRGGVNRPWGGNVSQRHIAGASSFRSVEGAPLSSAATTLQTAPPSSPA